MTLELQIKTEATRLGFNFCGITQPSPPLHYDTYLHWLAEGCHAGMTFLARPGALQKRADPCELLRVPIHPLPGHALCPTKDI